MNLQQLTYFHKIAERKKLHEGFSGTVCFPIEFEPLHVEAGGGIGRSPVREKWEKH